MESRKVIWGAFALSVLLHLIIAAATWRIPFVTVDPQVARAAGRELELYLEPEEKVVGFEDADEPPNYTAVPEREESVLPPERKDYVALYQSLAADQTQDSDGETPKSDGESIINQVEIRAEDLSSSSGISYSREQWLQQNPAELSAGKGNEGETEEEAGIDRDLAGEWDVPRVDASDQRKGTNLDRDGHSGDSSELADWWADRVPSILKAGHQGSGGDRGFQYDQPAGDIGGTGVALDGSYSLNTYEWDYAPWMQHMSNEMQRYWIPPYAYYLGLISGATRVVLVIEPNGHLRSLEVIDAEGHDSLHDAVVAALKAFAPYAPLPENFPLDHLVLDWTLIYPSLRH